MAERIIENVSSSYAKPFFDEIIAHAVAIARNRYGNYVIQSFLEHNSRRRDCALAMLPHAKSLARSAGWFVLQYAIAHCDREVQTLFDEELARDNDRGDRMS